jgi:mannose-6-phosphate isomerase-like protein (cupin superfamily)
MSKRIFALIAATALGNVFPIGLMAQTTPTYAYKKPPNPGGNSYPGPELVPYPATRDSMDRRIDMFMSDWRESLPRHTHGSLVLRDILTRGDNFSPPERGAVFQRFNSLSHGILAAHNSTTPSKLEGQQEVFYILSGKGEVKAGGETAAIQKDFAILIPAALEFVMHNTGDEALTMFVINEPTPANFTPAAKMAVRNERAQPPAAPTSASPLTNPGASGHWAHITRELFTRADGLATIGRVITVTIGPLSLGEPHTHEPGHEEIWAAIEGTSLAYLGTQLRVQKPGMAYMLRPDVTMMHSNINYGDTPVKFLWFSASRTSDPGTIIVNQPLTAPGGAAPPAPKPDR